MDEEAWDSLVIALKARQCTPFLGAGVSHPPLPLGAEIATKWALDHGYPFGDTASLARVAQYRVVRQGEQRVKLELLQCLAEKGRPDFSNDLQPHAFLADMDLPLYFTTNYDTFLEMAIKVRSQESRKPVGEFCRWRSDLRTKDKFSLEPSRDAPLVYHLHGIADPRWWRSLVLTEDDYLEFVYDVAANPDGIPEVLHGAFTSTALLFLGYGLEDLSFKVILARIQSFLNKRAGGPRHVAVQLSPRRDFGPNPPNQADLLAWEMQAKQYLADQYDLSRITVYWGEVSQFLTELKERL